MAIILSFVGSVVDLVVGKLAECTVETIGRQFGYLICYRRNIKDLKEEIVKLDHLRTGVVRQVKDAKINLQVLGPDVVQWQEDVDETCKRVTAFLEGEVGLNDKCLNGWCLNPKSCYLLGRKAKKMSLEVVKLQEAGKFDKIAYPGSPPKMGPCFAPGIKDLQSRRLMFNEVVEALKDDKISEIVICGMPAVGKTTLVTQIVKEIERGDVFHKVSMAVMSQNPDLRKIQGEIADRLGLKFDVESLSGRAEKLRLSIMNSDERILIILDDAWEKPDFGSIGLPFGGEKNGYKIVFTSRNKDIWGVRNGQRIFILEVLSDEEGWDLFRETAGDFVDDPDLHPIAKAIAMECGGLPIAIVTIAKALKGKSISCTGGECPLPSGGEASHKNIWENALLELRKRVRGVQGPAFSCIELSYNYLAREETKSCFLLCCLFPEDWNILINVLVDYGFGLRLFDGVENLEQARNRVYALVSDLKTSFLLLDGRDSKSVKMHDLVRDVAISIASRDKNEFLVRHDAVMKGWPQTNRYKYYTAISLKYDEINEHPNDLDCPKLELLKLICIKDEFLSIPDNIFEGLKGLKVLFLVNPSRILPQSLQLLKNLRTLILYAAELEGLSNVGVLEKLEILRIGINSLTKLPSELGQLTSLLLLDLKCCGNLKHIPPDVLSRLSKLEELYIPLSFKNWDTVIEEEDAGKIVNGSIRELESLHLTVLEVCIPDASLVGVKESFFTNLKTFKIILGSESSPDWNSYQGNCLRFEGNYNDYQKCGIYVLGNKVEVLELKMNNLKDILLNLDKDCFPPLKVLHLSACNEIGYIVDGRKHSTAFPRLEKLHLQELSNLKEIWHKHLPMSSSFSNLRELNVCDCTKLKFVFTLSMATWLCQLQKLFIKGCMEMEGVLVIRNEEDKKMTRGVIFPQLKTLELESLPKLLRFCIDISNAVTAKTPLDIKDVNEDTEELSASEMEFQVADSIKITPVFFSTPCPRLPNLNFLRLKECGLLEAVFSPSIVNEFTQLEELKLGNCTKMVGVLLIRNEEDKKLIRDEIFPKLETLSLESLHKLYSFCIDINNAATEKSPLNRKDVNESMEELSASETEFQVDDSIKMRPTLFSTLCPRLPNLKKLSLWGCNLQEALFSPSIVNPFEQLEELKLENCTEMVGLLLIRNKEDKKLIRDEIFPKLETLSLENLPKLFSFYVDINNAVIEKTLLNRKDVDEGVKELSASEIVADSTRMKSTFFSTPCPRLPNLSKLWFWSCGLLQAIFSPSIVNQFVQLEILEVGNCDSMECIVMGEEEEEEEGQNKEKLIVREIIEEEEGHNIRSDKIVFPQLRLLRIWFLKNLKCFYGGSKALEFPSLQQMVYLSDCMETFSTGALSTPMLEKITLNYISARLEIILFLAFGIQLSEKILNNNHKSYFLKEGDLNTTIQHLFKTQYKYEDSPDLEEASSSTN